MDQKREKIDLLVAESERLREELLRTATRLETFSNVLLTEVTNLREEVADSVAREEEGRTDDAGR